MDIFGLEVTHMWFIAAVVFGILEVLTTALFMISLGAGAAASGIVAYVGLGLYSQLTIFAAVALATFLAARRLGEHAAEGRHDVETNVAALIGVGGIVTTAIGADAPGYVKLGGEEWRALPDDGASSFGESTRVTVARLEGNTVYVVTDSEQ